MVDHVDFQKGLSPETRAALTERDDAAGLRHLSYHTGVILLLALWVALGLPFWPVVLLPLGVALAFLFTLQHECTHKTPFRTPWINEVVGHITGVILFQPFYWFRAFHMAHHRHTNNPEHDPELSNGKPETTRDLLFHLSTLGYWRDKANVLFQNAGGVGEADYLSTRQIPAIRGEALMMVVIYVLAFAFTLFVSPILFWVWFLPLVLGFPVLRLYLLAEHGKCPAVADMFDNTRTTLTNRLVRFLAWNMPYHAEHHAMPTVPFFRLPKVHALARAHLKRVSNGYGSFTREMIGDLQRD